MNINNIKLKKKTSIATTQKETNEFIIRWDKLVKIEWLVKKSN